MANPWMTHLASVWKRVKGKMSYKQAMVEAKKSYKKGSGKSDDAPKKKRRRRKKKSQ